MAASCPPILAPETANCSGRGECLSATVCDCLPGWTGHGDFVFSQPTCSVNLDVIRGLWGACAAVNAALFLFAIYYLIQKTAQQKTRSKSPKVYGICTFTQGLAMLITGSLRASAPERVIGTDTAVTVFFFIGSTACWIAAHVFIYSFISLAIKQTRVVREADEERILLHMRMSLPVSSTISTIACIMPLAMLGSSSEPVTSALATTHYVVLAVSLCIAGLWLAPSFVGLLMVHINDVTSQQAGNTKNQVLAKISAKMRRFQTELRNQVVSQLALACLMGFWPFLQVSGSSYFLPFAWSSGAFIHALGMYLHLPVSEKGSMSATAGSASAIAVVSSSGEGRENVRSYRGGGTVASSEL